VLGCVDLPDTPFDPDYQAILDRGTALGYTLPSPAQQVIQNQLVLDLKNDSIWGELDLLYVFATDGDENFAKINWVSPSTFLLTKTGTVTFSTNSGFEGDGTTGYLANGFIPSTDAVHYTQDNASVFVDSLTDVSTSGFVFGCNASVSNPSLLFGPRDGSNRHIGRVNTNVAEVKGSGVSSLGTFQIQRTGSATSKIFKNGTQVGTDLAATSNGLPTKSVPIFANNNNGVISSFSNNKLSCFGLGSSLSGKESTLKTIWNDYFTSL